jgi:hypothetical protein
MPDACKEDSCDRTVQRSGKDVPGVDFGTDTPAGLEQGGGFVLTLHLQ